MFFTCILRLYHAVFTDSPKKCHRIAANFMLVAVHVGASGDIVRCDTFCYGIKRALTHAQVVTLFMRGPSGNWSVRGVYVELLLHDLIPWVRSLFVWNDSDSDVTNCDRIIKTVAKTKQCRLCGMCIVFRDYTNSHRLSVNCNSSCGRKRSSIGARNRFWRSTCNFQREEHSVYPVALARQALSRQLSPSKTSLNGKNSAFTMRINCKLHNHKELTNVHLTSLALTSAEALDSPVPLSVDTMLRDRRRTC